MRESKHVTSHQGSTNQEEQEDEQENKEDEEKETKEHYEDMVDDAILGVMDDDDTEEDG